MHPHATPSLAGTTSLSAARATRLAVLGAAALVGLIAGLGPPLDAELSQAAGYGNFVYRWQLATPSWITRSSAWGPYLLHQLSMWGLIYYAQHHVRRYSPRLHRVNLAALGLNLAFALLHVAQTHLFYDGLAQDVHEASALLSVVFLLVLVLLMENHRRGMFFGVRLPLRQRTVDWVRRYHGYYFSWAITYTFWYHPTEVGPGHLAGFAYMFLLMIQGSLFFTSVHVHRGWTFLLESAVVVHSAVVAWQMDTATGSASVGRFVFGFLGLVVVTQMHGLGLSRRVRAVLAVIYLLAVVTAFQYPVVGTWSDVLRIPIAEYTLVLLFAALISLGLRIHDRLRSPQPQQPLSDPAPR